MKGLTLLPIACLAGIIIGAWGPRKDLSDFKKNALGKAMEEGRWSASRAVVANGFQSFSRLANIHDETRHAHRRRPDAKPLFAASTNKTPDKATTPASKPQESGGDGKPQENAATAENSRSDKQEPLSKADLRARIEEAQELWSTRVELARAKWKEKLGLDDAAAEKFNSVLDGMNEQLYDTMQTMASLLAQQEKMTPELGLRLTGDATTIMAETYEKLGACVPPERRGEVSEMQVFDFIDPGVAEPLIAVQDKLDGLQMQPGDGSK